MLPIAWRIILVTVVLGLAACGEPASAPGEPPSSRPVAGPSAPDGRLAVDIIPDSPSAGDCLYVKVKGQPPAAQIVWTVNGQVVDSSEVGRLCPGAFRRGDAVSVKVGGAAGGSASVIIADSPPRVTGISATPEQVFAGSDIQVSPVAEDRDGDPVEFRYQWLINGEEDPFLTDNLLPGNRFKKGDVVRVRIVPYDGIAEGPVYESYAMTIPNAPPQILSRPPQQFEALEYRYQVKARDPDGDRLRYLLTKSPPGMTVDSASGLVTWPLAGVQPGTYPLRVLVRDQEGAEAFQEFSLTLGAPAAAPPAEKS